MGGRPAFEYLGDADPVRVKAVNTMVPGQHAISPMCHTIGLEFAAERQLIGTSHFNNIVTTPELYAPASTLGGSDLLREAGVAQVGVSDTRVAAARTAGPGGRVCVRTRRALAVVRGLGAHRARG